MVRKVGNLRYQKTEIFYGNRESPDYFDGYNRENE